MNAKHTARLMLLALAVLATSFLDLRFFEGEANAIVGRPLTPVSYAGVARRTTRRTVAAAAVTPGVAVRYW
jgi:hypothetical protein